MIAIGPFELITIIGQGGMGDIWRGRHLDQNVEVAVKVMSASMANLKKHEQLFASEVRAVASLHHRNIVRVYDHGKISRAAADASSGQLSVDSPYLVMELAAGGSLADRPRPTSWPALMHILLQVLDGLAHAHAHEIFHRDLKLGNVLVTDENAGRPTVKLTDFGLVQLAAVGQFSQAAEQYISGAGTPGYMAPEQIRGCWRQIGPWTDLYALGCMVYELASGALPMTKSNVVHMAMAHLHEMPDPFVPTFAVPPELDAWVAKLFGQGAARALRARRRCRLRALESWLRLACTARSAHPSQRIAELPAARGGQPDAALNTADHGRRPRGGPHPRTSRPNTGTPHSCQRAPHACALGRVLAVARDHALGYGPGDAEDAPRGVRRPRS
ncbi:MAG: serine/threonine protein kinase [Bradymonadaceae bacterium]|nr:serine/threonine protein kinase [Lujinxingiaceae bacterium]